MAEILFHGWFRPSPRPRQRAQLWVRVTAEPMSESEARNAASDFAARRGGGDTVAERVGVNPNLKEYPR